MKKIIFAALLALTTIICVSATTASNSETSNSSNATVEYVIPNIISGSIQLDQFKKIYALMPQDVKEQAEIAYNDIVSKNKSDFHYVGVRVKHTETTWEFYYNGGKIIVRNATRAELNEIFNGVC
jgi:hypothetical protein